MQATERTVERLQHDPAAARTAAHPLARSVGIVTALLGGAIGVLAGFVLFIQSYHNLIQAELSAGRPDEAFIVTYVIPALTDLAIVGGVLWLLAAYGFFKSERWATPVAIAASVLSVAASFFPLVPAMSRKVFPSYALIFGPNLVFFFVLLAYVRPTGLGRLLLSLFGGIASVLCFMNGVASIDKILVTGRALFVPVQQISWLAAVGWGVFTVGVLLYRSWSYPLGLAAGLAAAVAGLPLAYTSTLELGRFSLFSPAPLVSIGILVYLWTRRGRELLQGLSDVR